MPQLRSALVVLVVLTATACTSSVAVPASPPVGPPGASGSSSGYRPSAPADGSAPHEAENNSWKERHALSAEEQREGKALAARVRRALTPLRSERTMTPEATETALVGLGLEPDDVTTEPVRTGADAGTPPPGSVFAVRFGGVGCVVGSLGTDRLEVEVTGAAAEFGCLEPFSH